MNCASDSRKCMRMHGQVSTVGGGEEEAKDICRRPGPKGNSCSEHGSLPIVLLPLSLLLIPSVH